MSETSFPPPMSIMPVTAEELQASLGLTGEAVAKKLIIGTGQVQGFGGANGGGAGGYGGAGSAGNGGGGGGGSSGGAAVYKVREFEWFEVETKVRRFVNELMQPAIKRVALDKRLLEEISEKISTNDEQVKSLYDFIHYSHNRVKVLDDINEKIALTNTGLEIAQNRHRQQEEKIHVFQDNIMREMTTIRQETANVLKMKEQLTADRITLVEYFENFKKNTSEVISQLQKELTDSQTTSKTEFMRTWDSIFKVQNNVQQHAADLVTDADKLNELFKKITDIRVKNTSYENSIEQMEKDIESLQDNINIAKKFSSKVEDLGNQFRMVENYVEKYHQLYVQGQISDTLFNCLDRNQKKRLVSYEEKTFNAMNNRLLLDDGEPNLGKKIQEAITYVETIVKRNAKFHHNLKKTGQSSQANAENIGGGGDYAIAAGVVTTNDGRQTPNENPLTLSQINANMNMNASLVGDDGNGGGGDDNAPLSPKALSRQRRTTVYENHVSHIPAAAGGNFSPTKSLKRSGSRVSMGSNSNSDDEDYKNTSRRLKAFFDAEVKKIKDNIEKKTWSLQKGLFESEEILSMSVSKVQEDVEKGISLLRKQHNNVVQETNALDGKITTIWTEIAKIATTFNVLSETVHKLIHFNSLFNSLTLQDELDKQTIALYGYNTLLNDDHGGGLAVNSHLPISTATNKVSRQMRSSMTMAGQNGNGDVNSGGNTGSSSAHSSTSRVPLQLDGNCLSCTPGSQLQQQHQLQVIQSFKLACLSYAPSSVVIDGQSYKREEILEVTTHLLQAARQKYGLKSNPTELSARIADSEQMQQQQNQNEISLKEYAAVAAQEPKQQPQQQRLHSTSISNQTSQMRSTFQAATMQMSSSSRVNTLPNAYEKFTDNSISNHHYMYANNANVGTINTNGTSGGSASSTKNNSLSSVYNQLQARTPQGTLPSLDMIKIKQARSTSSKRPVSISSLSSSFGQNTSGRVAGSQSVNRKDFMQPQ